MAGMRFMLLLLLAWLCIAQALQGAFEDFEDLKDEENGIVLMNDDIAETAGTNSRAGGRKMWIDRKSMKVQEIGERKMKEPEEIMDMKRTVSRHGVDEDGGFVAFNADYHSPRHHPPKNN